MLVQNLYTTIVDIIFPRYCVSCNQEGMYLCHRCFQTLDLSGVFDCPVCHVSNGTGKKCRDCSSRMYITSHCAITSYHEDALIGTLMHAFKYAYVESVRDVFEQMIRIFLKNHPIAYEYVMPIPLHRRRYVERGFNQSAHIARILANHTGMRYTDSVVRHRYTKQQATLSRVERIENTTDAFRVKKGIDIAGKSILLVDDVFTTGSTLNSCAQVLLQQGAREVHSFTIARGVVF